MTSPQIKILVSGACVSILYAFVCDMIILRRARKLMNWLQQERPELWSKLNFVVKRVRGGQPALKMLKRKNAVDHPEFNRQYEQMNSMQRKVLWGIGTGLICVGLAIAGSRLWGWHW